MNMKMFGLVVASVVVLCIDHVKAATCVTDGNTAAVNKLISDLDTLFTPIVDGPDTADVKAGKVLQTICDTTKTDGANAKAKAIETQIAQCRELITASVQWDVLTFSGLKFIDIFQRFSSVDNFCACKDTLLKALYLMSKRTLLVNPSGVKYPFIKVSDLCSQDVKPALSKVADDLGTCPNIWQFTDFLTAANTKLMKTFIDEQCSKLNNTKFDCAVEYSKKDSFNSCVMDADKKTGDSTKNDKMCERRVCAMKSECGEGSEWYIQAVNMRKESMDTFSIDECNGVSSAVASLSVLIVALSALFLY